MRRLYFAICLRWTCSRRLIFATKPYPHLLFYYKHVAITSFRGKKYSREFLHSNKSWFTVHARTSVEDCLAVLSVCVYGGLLSHRLYIDKLITCVYKTRGHCLPSTLIIFWKFLVNRNSPNTSLIFLLSLSTLCIRVVTNANSRKLYHL